MDDFNPVETRREEFRKYIDKYGVSETLSNILCCLYEEEKSQDPLEYIKKKLREESIEQYEIDSLQRELKEIKERIIILRKENNVLKEKNEQLSNLLSSYEGSCGSQVDK